MKKSTMQQLHTPILYLVTLLCLNWIEPSTEYVRMYPSDDYITDTDRNFKIICESDYPEIVKEVKYYADGFLLYESKLSDEDFSINKHSLYLEQLSKQTVQLTIPNNHKSISNLYCSINKEKSLDIKEIPYITIEDFKIRENRFRQYEMKCRVNFIVGHKKNFYGFVLELKYQNITIGRFSTTLNTFKYEEPKAETEIEFHFTDYVDGGFSVYPEYTFLVRKTKRLRVNLNEFEYILWSREKMIKTGIASEIILH